MRKFVAAIALLTGAIITGCSSAPQPVVVEQPMAAAQPQAVAATCINSQGMVMADQWCDPNYIAQERALAIQQNNQALLASLLMYHMVYSSHPYAVGVYASPGSYYATAPRGYVVQPRSVYVTHQTTVVNHTTVVNSTSRPATTTSPAARPTFSSSSPSASRTPSYSSPTRSSYSSPSSSSRPSFSSSSSSSSRRH